MSLRDMSLGIFLPAFLFFWATLLLFVSFSMENAKIFWTQRILALVFMVAAFVALYYA